MIFQIRNTRQLGKVAQLVRQTQGLDQVAAAAMSSNGPTFMSHFENGKETVEIGRVLRVLDALGVEVNIDIPVEEESLTVAQRRKLMKILNGADL